MAMKHGIQPDSKIPRPTQNKASALESMPHEVLAEMAKGSSEAKSPQVIPINRDTPWTSFDPKGETGKYSRNFHLNEYTRAALRHLAEEDERSVAFIHRKALLRGLSELMKERGLPDGQI